MSASKQKKNRTEQPDALSKKAAAAAEQAKKDKAFRRNTIIAVAIIVVIVAAALVINSNLFYTRTNAVQVGDTKYSPAEVDFFYKNAFNQVYEFYYSQLGSSISMLLDTSKPLSEQTYSGDTTWADYVFETAQSSMKQATAYYDAAVKAGYTINDEDMASVNSNLELMKSYAESNGFPTLNKFLASYYGKGMTEKLYTELNKKVVLADRYAEDIRSSLTYTDEELEAYYTAHADEMDVYDYYAYNVSPTNEKFSDLDEEGQKAAAHDAAAEIAKATDGDAFVAAVKDFAGADTGFTMSHTVTENLNATYKDWLTDPARKTGDTTVVDGEGACFALMFEGKDDNDYSTVGMRHILIMVEADENGAYTEEAKAAAKEKLEGIYGDWKLVGADEASFANLANEYSEDTGSNTNGGEYTDITKNQMVPAVNDFLFAKGRKVGDTEIVYNEGSYTGYHLLYFTGETGNNHRQTLARDAKTTEDYNAKYEALSSGYEVTVNKAVKYANLT